jgi:hypothetical protein
MNDFTWIDEAYCAPIYKRDLDFFGELTPEIEDVCFNCPVRLSCLDHALKSEQFGIWAGTTEEERVVLRRKMNISQPHFDRSMNRQASRSRSKDYSAFPITHGTEKGYQLHIKRHWDFNDEDGLPCLCQRAHTEYIREYREKRKQVS